MNVDTFIETYPKSLIANPEVLDDAEFRQDIYTKLHPCPEPSLLALVRELFQREQANRFAHEPISNQFESLYWAAMFLYQIGDVSDVIPMWKAKNLDMDSGAGFDVQFLVGPGIERTLDYLDNQKPNDSRLAAAYIRKCDAAGDFDDMDEWLSAKISYYS